MNVQGNDHLHTRECDQTMNRGIHSIALPPSEGHFSSVYFEGLLSQHINSALGPISIILKTFLINVFFGF